MQTMRLKTVYEFTLPATYGSKANNLDQII